MTNDQYFLLMYAYRFQDTFNEQASHGPCLEIGSKTNQEVKDLYRSLETYDNVLTRHSHVCSPRNEMRGVSDSVSVYVPKIIGALLYFCCF